MAMTQSCPQGTQRAFRCRAELLVRMLFNLVVWMRRRRQIRESAALLESCNDRLLADIGLRRDRGGRPTISRF